MRTFPNISPQRQWVNQVCLAFLLSLGLPVQGGDIKKLTEQLDRLDRVELLELLGAAETCFKAGDLACADSSLVKAKKFAKGGSNFLEWSKVANLIADAKVQYALERVAQQEAEEDAARERRSRANEEEEKRERDRREEHRLAAQEREAESNAQILGVFNAVIQNFNSVNAAQQLAAQRQASEMRTREAQTERSRQRAASQRLAEERSRLAEQREASERRQKNADIEKSNMERSVVAAASERDRAQRIQAEQRAEADQRAREQSAVDARQRQEREKAERLAQQEAAKAALRKEMLDYHAGMASGIRLAATKCPGDKRYYVTGTAPSLKEPRGAARICVAYEASCPNQAPIHGTAQNFIGMSGCFGDTYEINPQPRCEVREVQVRVVSVQSCS